MQSAVRAVLVGTLKMAAVGHTGMFILPCCDLKK